MVESASVALNIKNPHTERLAQLIARETGETLTQAVTIALEERLERLRGSRMAPDTVQAILEIAARCSALPDLDKRTPDEILGYDETGGFSSGD